MKLLTGAAAAALLLSAGAAQAADKQSCGKNMVCASAPQTVFDALARAGYEPEMTTDALGDPQILAADGSWNFSVDFYGCEDHEDCSSLQFYIGFEDDGLNTPELANGWNDEKRFIKLSVNDENTLEARYDVATIGGVNQANFADVIDWWQTMLGQLGEYFDETGS